LGWTFQKFNSPSLGGNSARKYADINNTGSAQKIYWRNIKRKCSE